MPVLPSGHPVLLRRRSGAARQPVVLLACGSFNPPTIAHLRMFELAADALREVSTSNFKCWHRFGAGKASHTCRVMNDCHHVASEVTIWGRRQLSVAAVRRNCACAQRFAMVAHAI